MEMSRLQNRHVDFRMATVHRSETKVPYVSSGLGDMKTQAPPHSSSQYSKGLMHYGTNSIKYNFCVDLWIGSHDSKGYRKNESLNKSKAMFLREILIRMRYMNSLYDSPSVVWLESIFADRQIFNVILYTRNPSFFSPLKNHFRVFCIAHRLFLCITRRCRCVDILPDSN